MNKQKTFNKLSLETLQPINVRHRKGNTSIYWPLSYPFDPCKQIEWVVVVNKVILNTIQQHPGSWCPYITAEKKHN